MTMARSSATGFFSAGAFSRVWEADSAGALVAGAAAEPGAAVFAAGPPLSLAGSEGFLLQAEITSSMARTSAVICTRIATSDRGSVNCLNVMFVTEWEGGSNGIGQSELPLRLWYF